MFSCISAPLQCHFEASHIKRWIFSPTPSIWTGLEICFDGSDPVSFVSLLSRREIRPRLAHRRLRDHVRQKGTVLAEAILGQPAPSPYRCISESSQEQKNRPTPNHQRAKVSFQATKFGACFLCSKS